MGENFSIFTQNTYVSPLLPIIAPPPNGEHLPLRCSQEAAPAKSFYSLLLLWGMDMHTRVDCGFNKNAETRCFGGLMFRLYMVGLVFSLMACSGGSNTTKGPNDDTDSNTSFPVCLQSCDTPADCDAGSAAYDADNYDCASGVCEWTGCNSDAECEAVLPGSICTQNATGPDYCAPVCSTAADCDMGSAPFDADNYTCDSGVCTYTGCNSNEECASVFGGNYVCGDSDENSFKTCTLSCDTTEQCSLNLNAFDSDNYECRNNECVYLGCNTDQECADDIDGTVCR